ncbi:protein DD3-3-like [Elysia marginata]|uniref:Protein DD3-3-like n=1 Tax=Elysia marginata TaxID=1093978 RepID=A0AAV4FB12_9GAST|nr:protein DD3-3-like [Elysia marginata]
MTSMKKYQLSVFLTLLGVASADIYLHNPRGSNNRLDEKSRNRANANNIFDSQNNERGGYNVGSLFYYQGSVLPIEWTNQHSCSHENNHCDLVIQYMCHDNVRDGTTTQTIPTNRAMCENYECSTDRRYRMHEDYQYYTECSMRSRNMNLFTADQQMRNRNSARNTRQNPKGTRRGYECPEERDHYPYWHPTPWIDVAVLTSNVRRCRYYQSESQNVKSRWACVFPPVVMERAKGKILLPNNKEKCEQYELPKSVSLDGTGHTSRKPKWQEFPSHGVAPPECREAEWTRDNHLGNTLGGNPPMFNWTIPTNIQHENCVLRIRYNISTSDYDPWGTSSEANADPKRLGQGSKVKMAEKFGFPNEASAQARGYVFKNNPVVKVFDGLDLDLRLAINTAQFGRVFQDRSHSFAVRPAPEDLKDTGGIIRNLNVRGKRGNIVQVYPAVEYDFVPNTLEMAKGDYVHIQWTGSNTNPNNNDGQGLAGSDRNNIVLLDKQIYQEGNGNTDYHGGKFGHFGRNYPMDAANSTFLGLAGGDAVTLAYVNPGQFRGEVSELDDAGTYFNLPPRKVTQAGTYHYMSTRNNNFSNRDQKGRVIVGINQYVLAAIGCFARLIVNEGTFDGLKKIRLEKWDTSEGEKMMKAAGKSLDEGDDYASDFYLVTPENLVQSEESQKTFMVEMKVSDSDDVEIYHATEDLTVWSKADADIGGGKARIQAKRGGIFVARKHSKVAMIVGVTVACFVVLVAVIVGGVFYFRRNPAKWQAVKTSCSSAKLSMQSKV